MFDWIKGDDTENGDDGVVLLNDVAQITGHSSLVAGTRVASDKGWQPVETLNVGDRVLTFDNDMQPITGLRRETLPAEMSRHLPDAAMPVLVPRHALCNQCDMWLMPEQGLMIECDAARDALGDPFAVVQSQSLTGFRGICRQVPPGRLDLTVLSFANDEVIYLEGGLLAHCPRPRDILAECSQSSNSIYDVFNLERGRLLVEHLKAQDFAASA